MFFVLLCLSCPFDAPLGGPFTAGGARRRLACRGARHPPERAAEDAERASRHRAGCPGS